MSNLVVGAVSGLGRNVLSFFIEIGRFGNLMGRVVMELHGLFHDRGLFIRQAVNLGTNSLPPLSNPHLTLQTN